MDDTKAISHPYLLIALLAVLLAFLQIHGVEPGWMFWDSHLQWRQAQAYLERGMDGAKELSLSSQWPLAVLFSKIFWLKAGFSIWAYGLFQAVLLNFSLGFLAYRASESLITSILLLGLAGLNPVVMDYAVFHSSDTLFAVALLLSAGFLSRPQSWSSCAGLLFCALLAFCSRKNGPTIVPVLMLLVLVDRRSVPFRTRLISALLLGMVSVSAVVIERRIFSAYDIPIRSTEIFAPGVIRRNFLMYKVTKDAELRDALQAVGIDPAADWDDGCFRTMWCRPLFGTHSAFTFAAGPAQRNIDAYLAMLRRAPDVWFSVMWRFAEYDLGFAERLHERELGIRKIGNDPDPIWPANDRVRLNRGISNSRALGWGDGVLARPWIHFAVLAVLITLTWMLRMRAAMRFLFLVVMLGTVVFVPALFISLNSEVRYYFPVGILSISAILIVCIDVLRLEIGTCAALLRRGRDETTEGLTRS